MNCEMVTSCASKPDYEEIDQIDFDVETDATVTSGDVCSMPFEAPLGRVRGGTFNDTVVHGGPAAVNSSAGSIDRAHGVHDVSGSLVPISAPICDHSHSQTDNSGPLGDYTILAAYVDVGSTVSRSGDVISKLFAGSSIKVVDIIQVDEEQRVRARIEEPAGYISLLNMASGFRFAAPAESAHRLAATPRVDSCFSCPPQQELMDTPGRYRIAADYVDVGSQVSRFEHNLAKLYAGDDVQVLEVFQVLNERRVRGRISHPAGFISLKNLDSGFRFANPVQDGPLGDNDGESSPEAVVRASRIVTRNSDDDSGSARVLAVAPEGGVPFLTRWTTALI